MNIRKRIAGPIVLLAVLASPLSAKNVKVTMAKTDDNVITGFVTGGNASALVISQVPNAPANTGANIPVSQIKNIYWEEPEDWKAAWELWTRRDYAAASKAFEDVAKSYANLSQIEDSFGSRAKYHQLECLRRTGKYATLMDIYDEVKRVNLSARYQKQIQLFNYWGHVGKKLWEPLKLITDRFEKAESEVPSHTVPPQTMTLKGLEPGLMIQIAYMRGIATEMLAREEHKNAVAALDPELPETKQAVVEAWSKVKAAMTDYGRVYTLTYMSERLISKDAMSRSMAIIKEDPDLEDNYPLQKEAYAIASFYKDLYGKGSVPAGYESFLVEPKPPSEIFADEGLEAEKKAKENKAAAAPPEKPADDKEKAE